MREESETGRCGRSGCAIRSSGDAMGGKAGHGGRGRSGAREGAAWERGAGAALGGTHGAAHQGCAVAGAGAALRGARGGGLEEERGRGGRKKRNHNPSLIPC
ncbi:hypothetical protein BS78_10G110900 [Paspalum vaginatum]|nr:hypothetical protein BS78_10G110900 [Paspalum vaginatum]